MIIIIIILIIITYAYIKKQLFSNKKSESTFCNCKLHTNYSITACHIVTITNESSHLFHFPLKNHLE